MVERVNAGLARVRAQWKRLRRLPVSTDVVECIRAQLATGARILKAAKTLDVGTGTARPEPCLNGTPAHDVCLWIALTSYLAERVSFCS
jgi:hypothetical protein